jgi:hypothetical protein
MNPSGVLVASDFSKETLDQIEANRFKAIRLSRFKTNQGLDYYVIIEDRLGDIVSGARRSIGWGDLVLKNLVSFEDEFCLKISAQDELSAVPVQLKSESKSKYLRFSEDARGKILSKAEDIEKRNKIDGFKSLDATIEEIKDNKPIILTHATRVVYLAYGMPRSYWVPGQYWIHKKSAKSLQQIINQINATV